MPPSLYYATLAVKVASYIWNAVVRASWGNAGGRISPRSQEKSFGMEAYFASIYRVPTNFQLHRFKRGRDGPFVDTTTIIHIPSRSDPVPLSYFYQDNIESNVCQLSAVFAPF